MAQVLCDAYVTIVAFLTIDLPQYFTDLCFGVMNLIFLILRLTIGSVFLIISLILAQAIKFGLVLAFTFILGVGIFYLWEQMLGLTFDIIPRFSLRNNEERQLDEGKTKRDSDSKDNNDGNSSARRSTTRSSVLPEDETPLNQRKQSLSGNVDHGGTGSARNSTVRNSLLPEDEEPLNQRKQSLVGNAGNISARSSTARNSLPPEDKSLGNISATDSTRGESKDLTRSSVVKDNDNRASVTATSPRTSNHVSAANSKHESLSNVIDPVNGDEEPVAVKN